MTSSRKQPGVAFWATVVVVVVLLYVASFGPACWIASRSRSGGSALAVAYLPIVMSMTVNESDYHPRKSEPRGIYCLYPEGAVNSYAQLCAAEGWGWRCKVEEEFDDRAGRTFLGRERQWAWCDTGEP